MNCRAVPAGHGVRDVRQAADVPARAPLPAGPLQRQRRAHVARPHRVRLLRGARHGLHRLQGGTDYAYLLPLYFVMPKVSSPLLASGFEIL